MQVVNLVEQLRLPLTVPWGATIPGLLGLIFCYAPCSIIIPTTAQIYI